LELQDALLACQRCLPQQLQQFNTLPQQLQPSLKEKTFVSPQQAAFAPSLTSLEKTRMQRKLLTLVTPRERQQQPPPLRLLLRLLLFLHPLLLSSKFASQACCGKTFRMHTTP
jgi:hypothetical protein